MAEKDQKPTIRIVLTTEQRDQIRRVTGKDVPALELTPELLEERIAPAVVDVPGL
jgi:hypothetical protein